MIACPGGYGKEVCMCGEGGRGQGELRGWVGDARAECVPIQQDVSR